MRSWMRFSSLVALVALSIVVNAAGTAPVADAAMAKEREAVKALLKSGADVNAAQGDGRAQR